MMGQLDQKNKRYFHWAISLLIGLSATLTFTYRFTSFWKWSFGWQLLFGVFSVSFFIILAYQLIFYLTRSHLTAFSYRSILFWGVGSMFIGGLLIIIIPIHMPQVSIRHTLEVIATGQKNSRSQASEVWIIGLQRADGSTIPNSEVQLIGEWEIRNGIFVSYQNQPAAIRWSGFTDDDLTVAFVSHSWSGITQVRWDDQVSKLDLYNTANTQLITKLTPVQSNPFLRIVLYSAHIVCLGVLVFIVSVWLATRKVPTTPPTAISPRAWLYYALPCAFVWTIWLLVFWPGVMTSDSLDQWSQILNGNLTDWHPALHTMLYWLITRLWFSPAAVALAQIVILSTTLGLGFARIQHHFGVPKQVIWISSILFALSPANGSMIIYLEKSVLYSISVLILTLLILEIVVSNGTWLKKNVAWAVLGGISVLVTIFRHNGFAAGFGTPIVLILIYRQYWRPLILTFVFTIGLWLGIRGPFYNLLKVNVSGAQGPAIAPVVYQVGAHINAATPLRPEERNFLSMIGPLDQDWKYNCHTPLFLFYNGLLDWVAITENSEKLIQVWLDLTLRNPKVIIDHVICNSSFIWRITQPPETYMNAASIWFDSKDRVVTITPEDWGKELGIELQPLLPIFKLPLATWLIRSQIPELSWLIWRPAFYLYLALAGAIIAAIRLGSWKYLSLMVPIGLHSLLLMLAVLGVDFRYQYPVYLVGLLLGTVFIFGLPMKGEKIG